MYGVQDVVGPRTAAIVGVVTVLVIVAGKAVAWIVNANGETVLL
jgi:hypothetical protein